MFKKNFIVFFIIALSIGLAGCTNAEPVKDEVIQDRWHESPLFKSGDYTMIGDEGRLGFLYDDQEQSRFYPNKTQKYMWHFWGNEQELIGSFEVIGTHESSDKEMVIVPKQEISLLSPLNGANQHIPSNMMLPKSGMWKLDAYMNDKLFGTIYVKVHQK